MGLKSHWRGPLDLYPPEVCDEEQLPIAGTAGVSASRVQPRAGLLDQPGGGTAPGVFAVPALGAAGVDQDEAVAGILWPGARCQAELAQPGRVMFTVRYPWRLSLPERRSRAATLAVAALFMTCLASVR